MPQAGRSLPFFRRPLLDTSTGGIAILQRKEIKLQGCLKTSPEVTLQANEGGHPERDLNDI